MRFLAFFMLFFVGVWRAFEVQKLEDGMQFPLTDPNPD